MNIIKNHRTLHILHKHHKKHQRTWYCIPHERCKKHHFTSHLMKYRKEKSKYKK